MPKDLFHKIISNADFWSLFFWRKSPGFTSPGIVSFCYVSLPRVFNVGEFQELTRGTWWGATGSFRAQVRCFAGWRGGCSHDGSMGLVDVYLGTQIRPLFWLVKALFLGGSPSKIEVIGVYVLTHWMVDFHGWCWMYVNTPHKIEWNVEYLWQENVLGKSKFRDSVIFKTSSMAFCIPRCFFLGGLDLFVGAGPSDKPCTRVTWMLFYTATLPCGPVNSAPLEIQWSTAIGFWEMSFRCSRLKKDIKASQ